ncbi:YdcF family protein [Acinetobacter bohemicus]|uniref:YdcF family protein n=1 Tax=Acinetobacter lwoffii TaxID=28090 RepID=A0A9D2URT8_ACILW|nr:MULTISPECIES: YdcF family protein [Acinetobacter]MDM1781584.1 YdcF family protein [Acinetobacter indicus]HJF27533.1 YdcF family protein [Acinetobacter lwoffii]MCO8042960.1 YdcF family protein [Acinetobacter sp. S4400-12]MCU7225302.1 YdcF family protein [Acinetobacter bohemicus]QKQ69849.1 YdcF family protein [Acinetobacter sp. 10FS3-1]
MKNTFWMVRLVQLITGLFVLFGCLLVLFYSPFYSHLVVKGLNQFVSLEVNEVAAQSQKMAALSEHETLEPGSDLWIARQAYLQVIEQDIQQNNSANLVLIQARYKALQQLIEDYQRQQQEEKAEQTPPPQVPLLPTQAVAVEISDPTENVRQLLEWDSNENKERIEQYIEFLTTHSLEQEEASAAELVDEKAIQQELALLQDQQQKPLNNAKPYAIVVVGGGLTLDENGKDIVVNNYTRLRLETTLEVEKRFQLPIVLSGVEAPYMQRWLQQYDVDAKLLEDRSMNTCENSRFSSLLLQKKGGAPTVILITDRYHMPRTRRLFALNGIQTIPVEAPMPTSLTRWRPSTQNYDHSRRANYELLATIRDVWFGSSDCREVP